MPAPVAVPRKSEPLTLQAGDEVNFNKQLQAYLASKGWAVQYVGIGGGFPILWNATTDIDGVSFDIQIPSATTAAYIPGEYQLSGYASNSATGERYQFYLGALKVTANLQVAPPDQDTETYAQKGLRQCQELKLKMLQHDINDSSTEATEFRRKRLKEIDDELETFTRLRENELQKEAAMNGKPSRKKLKMRFLVTNPAGGLNQFGAGNQFTNFDGVNGA